MERSSTKRGKTFVASHPALMDMCDHPELVPLHGVMAGHEPHATDLIPLFSLSKTSMHADISGVPVEQWTDHRPNVAWENRSENALLWRGSNTGTDYSERFPWRTTHRTRLVQLANTLEGRAAQGHLSVLPLSKGELTSARTRSSTRTLRDGLAQIGVRRANQDWLDIKFTGNPIRECSAHPRHVDRALPAQDPPRPFSLTSWQSANRKNVKCYGKSTLLLVS